MIVEIPDNLIKATRTALYHQWHRIADDNGVAISCTQEIADATYEALQLFSKIQKINECKEIDTEEIWNRYNNNEPLTKDEYLYVIRNFNPNSDGPVTLFCLENDYKNYMESIQNDELEK